MFISRLFAHDSAELLNIFADRVANLIRFSTLLDRAGGREDAAEARTDADHVVLMGFPVQHRAKLHFVNPLERLNKMGHPGRLALGGPIPAVA